MENHLWPKTCVGHNVQKCQVAQVPCRSCDGAAGKAAQLRCLKEGHLKYQWLLKINFQFIVREIMGINDCRKTEVCLLELRSAFLKWIGSVWGSTWEGRLQWMIISSWHQPPASALLQTSCLLCCGEGNENKRLLWKKSLAIGQLVYSLDSKRLSHEGFISAASQFCREKKNQQCKGKTGQENKH